MAIQSSGPISLSDLATEFGGTIPHSISEYYREGGLVPANNTAVSTSGAIGLQMFYSAVNEIQVVAGAAATLDISTLFDASIWTSAVPKRVTIASGTIIGTTTIPSNMGGTLELDNAGDVIGLGGATGAAGGDAIINNATGVTINNTGLIAGGGGGGGTGGNGSFSQNVNSGGGSFRNNGNTCDSAGSSTLNASCTAVGKTGCNGGCAQERVDGTWWVRCTSCYTTQTVSTTGGSGGVGQGYNQAATAGATGGTNAGTGGTGGSYGTAGGTGSNGTSTSGSAGGAAGAAVSGTSITMNNTGTLHGTVV